MTIDNNTNVILIQDNNMNLDTTPKATKDNNHILKAAL